MVDAATKLRVQQVVLNHIASGTMFTAFDVTMEIRSLGLQLRHEEGKEIVHEMFQTGVMGAGYHRSVVDVGASVKPFVYHRFDSDPSSYRARNAGSPQAAPSTKQPGVIGRVLQRFFGTSSPAVRVNPVAGNTSSIPKTRSAPIVARGPVKLDLDASSFLPISRTELLQQSKGINLWGSPWFGRRDLIPPADDKRTNLIDRGMVTQGLITPEQLAEIHRVGAEMDRFRPSQVLIKYEAQKAGQAAVEAEKQAKRDAKAAKKAEAAERLARRREAIQAGKATDILFLGRGVSSQLNDRQSDVEKLQSQQLPILSTPSELAAALSISVSKLRWLAFHSEVATRTHYVHFDVQKKSGGVRTLSSPHRSLAAAQNWILREVLDRLHPEPAAHGFVSGRSILSNAAPHVGKEVVLNMDLENFFPCISFTRVRALFKRLGYSPSVATIFALLCTECPRRAAIFKGQGYMVATGTRGLPQGACTSPSISNLIARRLDRRLQGLADRLEITYTRYADDITFSGNDSLQTRIGYVMACIRHIAQDDGFSVNEKKSRVLRKSTAQSVTGLIVNEKPTLCRKKIRRLRAILHRAKSEGLAAQNRENHPHFVAWLEGSIAFLSMTRPELGQKMRNQLDA